VEARRPLDADLGVEYEVGDREFVAGFREPTRAGANDRSAGSVTLIEASSVEGGGPFDRAGGLASGLVAVGVGERHVERGA